MKHSGMSAQRPYRHSVRATMRRLLSGGSFSSFQTRRDARWTARLASMAALLMAWVDKGTLQSRFAYVRAILTEMFPGRRRVGNTYTGFIHALQRFGPRLIDHVGSIVRNRLGQWAGAYWTRQGCVAFAVDGSRVDCPRTEANEKALGCGGREKSGPQFWLTTLWHMGTGLPWLWRIGRSTDSERGHLREMLPLLPAGALLVADAGFTGYELLRSITSSGRSFLVRLGSNVHLLRDLGYVEAEDGQTVYLWPTRLRRSEPPVRLRLIVLQRKGKPIYLATNLDGETLSDRTAAVLYEMRWGVEVFYRSLKQTLTRRKMCSGAPQRARLELQWTLLGLQLLGLASVEAIIEAGHDPLCWSVAAALKAVRQAMDNCRPPKWGRRRLRGCLGAALKDRYTRRGSKAARNPANKKTERPPGAPKIRKATPSEANRAKELMRNTMAA